MGGHDHGDQDGQGCPLIAADLSGAARTASNTDVRVSHGGDPQRSQSEDDQQGGHGEAGVDAPRHENGEPLPGLIQNYQEDDDRRRREGCRLASPAGVELPESGP